MAKRTPKLNLPTAAQLKRMKPDQLRALAAVLVSRSRFSDNVDGLSFQGRRDYYRALGYSRKITPQMYRSRYLRNEVAARIVEAKPKATWRGGVEVIEDEATPDLTPFESAVATLESRLNFWSTLYKADVLAGLGRYAIILLGMPGDLDTPLERLDMKDLVYLTPFTEEDAAIEKFDTANKSRRYGLPDYYSIRRLTPNSIVKNTPETTGRRVHWTRVIHIADGSLEDHVYGIPRLQRIWNRLDDLEKVAGGGAEAFWKRADPGMQLNIDPMIPLGRDENEHNASLKHLEDQVDEWEHDLRRVFTTRGVKISTLSAPTAPINATVTSLMQLISVGSEVPTRILMGSEQAKLAATQDNDNWDERISDRRTEWAGPHVIRPFIQRLIELQCLPTPKKYDIRWPEMQNLTEGQKADTAAKWAGLNKAAGDVVVTGDEIRERILGLEPKGGTKSKGVQEGDHGTSQVPADPRTEGQPLGTLPDPSADPLKTSQSRWAAKSTRREGPGWSHIHTTADRFRTGLPRRAERRLRQG